MATPPIIGDLTKLDPANVAEDKDTLAEVQHKYNTLVARNAQQEEELNRLRQIQLETQMHYRRTEEAQRDGNVTQMLSGTLSDVSRHMASSAIAQTVTVNFDGKAKELPRFLEEIEKYTLLCTKELNDKDLIDAAYQFSRRTVSDFVGYVRKNDPDISWADFKALMKERFGEKADPQTLLMRLRNFAQRPGQSIQVFAGIVLKKAMEIFDEDLDTAYAQRELVSIFAKGLKSKTIAKKVIGDYPKTLADAVALAVRLEEKEGRLSAHGLRGEPMEVDAVNSKRDNPRGGNKGSSNSNGWRDGKPICFNCGKLGHMARDCRSKKKKADDNSAKVNEVASNE